MRGLIRGSAGLDQPVKDDRDDDDTAANADQAGEQSSSGARNHAQKDQPKGAHRALICQMNWNRGATDRAMLRACREVWLTRLTGGNLGFTPKSFAPRYQPHRPPWGAIPGGACTHWKSAALSRRTWKPDIASHAARKPAAGAQQFARCRDPLQSAQQVKFANALISLGL
jgi:hypothetical protein